MSKQILVIKGSPRKNGNTSAMADALIKGAKESGNEVTEVCLKDKKIGDCFGCGACQGNDGNCVQKDDMTQIYEAMKKADFIVLASPVYFYTWTSLMKRMIDSFRQYVSCFTAGGNEEGGILFAYGTNGPTDVKEMPVLEEAYRLGKEGMSGR